MLYGGGNPHDGTLSDAWEARFSGSAYGDWSELTQLPDPTHDLPPQRENLTFVVDPPRERAIVFGGLLSGEPWVGDRPATDQVWEFRLGEPGQVQWYRLSPDSGSSGAPSARDAHSAAGVFATTSGRMFVFGGVPPEAGGTGGTRLDETWELRWRYAPLFGGLEFAQCSPIAVFNDGVGETLVDVKWDYRLDVKVPSTAAVEYRGLARDATRCSV